MAVLRERLRGYGRLYDVISYGASQVLNQATGVARGLILPNFLGSGNYGLVATINAVNRYSPYTSFGVHIYVLYQLPVVRDEISHEDLINTIFTFTLLTSIISGLFCLLYGLFVLDSRAEVIYGLVTLSLNPISSGLWRIHQSLCRIQDRISLITRIQNAQSLFFFVLVIVLTFAAGIYGTFTAQLLSTLFLLVAMKIFSPHRFHIRLDGGLLWRALVYSFPIFFIAGILETSIETMYVFMIAHYLGTSKVGLYSLGASLSGLLFLWPKSMSVVFSTRIIKQVDQDVANKDVAGGRMFLRLLVANCVVFIGFVSIAYIFLPVIIRVIFPTFADAIPTARLLTLAIYYQAIGNFAAYVLLAQKRFNNYIVALAGFVMILYPVLWWVAPKGILFVAAVLILYRLVSSQVMLSMTVRYAFSQRLMFAGYCIGLYLLGLLPVVLTWLVDLSELPVTRSNFFSFAPRLSLIFFALILGFAGILYWLSRQSSFLRELSQT